MIHADRVKRVLFALLFAVLLAACGPEAVRKPGQPGADVQNKAADFAPRSKVFPSGSEGTKP